MTKCNHCRAENSDKVKYCTSCGYELPREEPKVEPQKVEYRQEAPSGRNLRAIIVGAVVGIALVVAANYGSYSLYKEKQAEVKRMDLVEGVSHINRQCPVMVDYATRLDNVKVEGDNEIHYNYTLVNLDKESMDMDALKEQMKASLLSVIQTNIEMKPFRDMEVIFSHNYKEQDGKELFSIVITPQEYK